MATRKTRSEVVPSARARILRVAADDASKLIQEQIEKGKRIVQSVPRPTSARQLRPILNELAKWDGYNSSLLRYAIFTEPSFAEDYDGLRAFGKCKGLHDCVTKLNDFYTVRTRALESIKEQLVLFEKAPQSVSVKDEAVATANTVSSEKVEGAIDKRNVVVVYGRNKKLKDSMFDFLTAIGLRPLDWIQLKTAAIEATGKGTPYIGEIVGEAFGQGRAVVVLLTGDDEARLREKFWEENDPPYERELTPQARPNVLFEAGMAMGKCDDRTILVQIGTLRPWTDVSGRHVTKFDGTPQKRHELIEELKAVGCELDTSGSQWMHVGDFEEQPDSQVNDRSRRKPVTVSEKQPAGKETALGTLHQRVNRILDLKDAEEQGKYDLLNRGEFTGDLKGQEITVSLPTRGGNFQLYFLWGQERLLDIWYVSILAGKINIQKELAEIRVLMGKCWQLENDPCTFIVATDDDLSSQSESIQQAFEKKKAFIQQDSRQLFSLEIWDKHGLIQKEEELGLVS